MRIAVLFFFIIAVLFTIEGIFRCLKNGKKIMPPEHYLIGSFIPAVIGMGVGVICIIAAVIGIVKEVG
jgi:hypothetical protein